MKTSPWMLAMVLVALAPACSTTRSRPALTELEDIPLPAGLTYRPAESVIIESPSATAARLVFRGRIQPNSLRLATRTMLEAQGWRHVNTASATGHSTIQAYEKAESSLQIDIYEGLWFTYLALSASRATLIAQPTPTADVLPGTASLSQADPGTPPGLSDQGMGLRPSGSAFPFGWKSAWERARDRIRAALSRLFPD